MRGHVALLFLIFLLPARCVAATLDPTDIRLTAVKGRVTLRIAPNGPSGPAPAYTHMALEEGDTLITANDGSAEISFGGGTLLRLRKNSSLRLRRITPKDISIVLNRGILLAKVRFDKNDGSQFIVITPSAWVQVRGTEFVIEETGKRARIGVLNEGHVAVTAPGFKKEIIMRFNQETEVYKGFAPRDQRTMERLYGYKVPMAEMRKRMKVLRKRWGVQSLQQRQRFRTAWIKAHQPARKKKPVAQRARPRRATKR